MAFDISQEKNPGGFIDAYRKPNIVLIPQRVWPHLGVLTVSVKARCSIEVVGVVCDTFSYKLPNKMALASFPCKHKIFIYIYITFFRFRKSIKFPYIAQLKYCKQLDFEADPNNKHLGVN